MSTTPATIRNKPPRKSQPVLRKSTRKSPAVQTAIIAKRVQGASVAQIARDLDISRNTVTSIVELSTVEQQIEQYRKDAVALAPLAIKAVSTQIEAGDGDLGLRLLDRIGVIGEDAIDATRRNTVKQHSAINVLVQPGATVTVNTGDAAQHTAQHSTVPLSSDTAVHSTIPNSTVTGELTGIAPSATGGGTAPAPTREAPKSGPPA